MKKQGATPTYVKISRGFFMNCTRLILIRHGETDYNAEKKYYGFSDPLLNNTGIWQANRLYERLKTEKIDKVYSSGLKRARYTAEIVFKNSEIKIFSDLREMNFGIFEGLHHSEIMEKYSQIYTSWIENPLNIKIPKGEAFKSFKKRVLLILKSIIAENTGLTVAIITHGGPIKIFLNEIFKEEPEKFWTIKQDSAALNIIDYVGGTRPEIVTSNDISHLM